MSLHVMNGDECVRCGATAAEVERGCGCRPARLDEATEVDLSDLATPEERIAAAMRTGNRALVAAVRKELGR